MYHWGGDTLIAIAQRRIKKPARRIDGLGRPLSVGKVEGRKLLVFLPRFLEPKGGLEMLLVPEPCSD